MPLSDHEQRILEEIERQFYEQDPRTARALSSQTLEAQLLRNFRRGIALFVLGFLVLGVFFFRPSPPVGPVVGVVGFVLMLAGATIAYQNVRKAAARNQEQGGPPIVSRIFGGIEQKLRGIRRRREG